MQNQRDLNFLEFYINHVTSNIKSNEQITPKLFKLKDQTVGIYIPPTIWYDTLYEGLNNSIMVLTNKKYSKNDYIVTKKEYLEFRRKISESSKYKNQ